MTSAPLRINLFDLVSSLAKTADLISPVVADHHLRVAYIAFRISQQLDWSPEQHRELVMAGALHDIGAFSLSERLSLQDFEYINPGQHARAGYLLLSKFKPFQGIAHIIHYHHLPWNHGKGVASHNMSVAMGSHILNLADRVAILLTRDKPVLAQIDGIMHAIEPLKDKVFAPELVDALTTLSGRDYFWLEAMSNNIDPVLRRAAGFEPVDISIDELVSFSRLMCQVIDFKSAFTATHSSGVSETAVALAEWMGFSGNESHMVRVAANLHDLGKLAIPSEILEKPGGGSNFSIRISVTGR
jgi:HD-GYP domain-containing protein (c-di-GMP phosphodiesterase class II)